MSVRSCAIHLPQLQCGKPSPQPSGVAIWLLSRRASKQFYCTSSKNGMPLTGCSTPAAFHVHIVHIPAVHE
jgi:hypothetical protein